MDAVIWTSAQAVQKARSSGERGSGFASWSSRSSASGSGSSPSRRKTSSGAEPHERQRTSSAGGKRWVPPPAEGLVELARLLELLHAPDAQEAAALELDQAEPAPLEGGVQLLDPTPRGPLRPERQGLGDLRAVHAVAARVRAAALGVLDAAVRHDLLDEGGQLVHLEVLLGAPDVERLVVDELERRLERGQKGACDVLDVHDRPPGSAVAHDQHAARRERVTGEVVDDQVAAQARRE